MRNQNMCIIQHIHWNQGGVFSILNKTSKNPFHTCTAPSPPPARPFSERNINCYFRHHRHCKYLKVLSMFPCWSSWHLYTFALCVTSWQYQQIRCFGGSSHHKQLLHCNHQPEIAWHGRLSTDLTNLNSKIQSGHTKTAQKNSFIQTFFWNFQMCRAVLCYIWMALAT